MTIIANDLKTKGISALDSVIDENQTAIITVHGREKYVVMKLAEYNRIRELEDAMRQLRADIAAGRFHSDGIDAHMERLAGV